MKRFTIILLLFFCRNVYAGYPGDFYFVGGGSASTIKFPSFALIFFDEFTKLSSINNVFGDCGGIGFVGGAGYFVDESIKIELDVGFIRANATSMALKDLVTSAKDASSSFALGTMSAFFNIVKDFNFPGNSIFFVGCGLGIDRLNIGDFSSSSIRSFGLFGGLDLYLTPFTMLTAKYKLSQTSSNAKDFASYAPKTTTIDGTTVPKGTPYAILLDDVFKIKSFSLSLRFIL